MSQPLVHMNVNITDRVLPLFSHMVMWTRREMPAPPPDPVAGESKKAVPANFYTAGERQPVI